MICCWKLGTWDSSERTDEDKDGNQFFFESWKNSDFAGRILFELREDTNNKNPVPGLDT